VGLHRDAETDMKKAETGRLRPNGVGVQEAKEKA